MTEEKRLVLILLKQDFPDLEGIDNISEPQRTGYLSQATRFLKLAKLFGYSKESPDS